MIEIENIEPLDAAILELGRRCRAAEITRARRDARLAELCSKQTELRRKRSRALLINTLPPLTFFSIEAI